MAGFTIRPAVAADAEAACAVVRQSIVDLCFDDHRGDQAAIAAWLENKTVANSAAWIDAADNVARIAEDETGVLGFALLTRAGKILLLHVAPRARLRGVSKALLAALEEVAHSIGLRELTLASTTTAQRFYLGCGYASDGESKPGARGGRSYPLRKSIA
jgi:GNAT superfamily N-acetyltransferase